MATGTPVTAWLDTLDRDPRLVATALDVLTKQHRKGR